MGREAIRKEIVGHTVDDIVDMFRIKHELERNLGIIDDSTRVWIRSEALDYVKTEFYPSKLGIKDSDVKKAIDAAVQEGE